MIAEFLESQGIVVDEPRPPVTPNISVPATPRSRVASRRISTSLPPVVRPTMAEESEESSAELSDSESELGSPMKKPKLETSLEALFPAPESLFPERTVRSLHFSLPRSLISFPDVRVFSFRFPLTRDAPLLNYAEQQAGPRRCQSRVRMGFTVEMANSSYLVLIGTWPREWAFRTFLNFKT